MNPMKMVKARVLSFQLSQAVVGKESGVSLVAEMQTTGASPGQLILLVPSQNRLRLSDLIAVQFTNCLNQFVLLLILNISLIQSRRLEVGISGPVHFPALIIQNKFDFDATFSLTDSANQY